MARGPLNRDKAGEEFLEAKLQARMADIREKLLVLSGKGGVGKSTLAATIAVALASEGHATGLLDADLHGPSMPLMLGLEDRTLAQGEDYDVLPLTTADGLEVVSISMMLRGKDDAVLWRGPMKHNAVKQLLRDVAWGALDVLVVDLPPGTGDECMSVARLVGPGAKALIVTTPQRVALADVRRCLGFCSKANLAVTGMVENMSGLTCPHCGASVDLFSSGGGESLAREFHLPFLGAIPLDPEICACMDGGAAYKGLNKAGPAYRAIRSVIRKADIPASH
jgi:Mrp family chromosome partitioning ATPase